MIHGLGRTAYPFVMALNNPRKDFARMLDEVEAVGNLHDLWCPGTYPTGVFPGPIPRDKFNPRLCTKPGGGSLGTLPG